METYLVQLTGVFQSKKFMENVVYVGTDIEEAKNSVDMYDSGVYLHVWNGGILVRTYTKISKNHGATIHWKLVKDYLQEMKAQAAALEASLSKITEVDTHKVGHKDDGEGGWYLA